MAEYLDLFDLIDNQIDEDINNYSFTITGDGGVVKSTFANSLFNRIGRSVTFGCEDRFKGIPNLKLVPIWKDGWAAFVGYKNRLRKGLKEGKFLPFDHMVIDPVGQLGKMCEKYVCQENGWDDLGSAPYGAGYQAFEKEFYTAISDLRNMGVRVDFVSHGKNETITPPRQEGYNVQMPDIQKKLKYLVKDEVDFLLYLSKVRKVDANGNAVAVRRLYLQNYPEFALKVPLDGFPDYIEWEGEVEEGVEKFINAFKKAVEYTNAKINGVPVASAPVKSANIAPAVDESANVNIDELREAAEKVRDNMIGSGMSKIDVANAMREIMGTAKVKEVEDPKDLIEFINKYQ